MKKQTKKLVTKKRVTIALISILLAGLIAAGTLFAVYKADYYDDAANQAGTVNIRELILTSVRGVKKDAPVDAPTGDIYFPEAKLYLPNPNLALPLTYLYDTGDVANAQSELSVSTYPVWGTTQMYTAVDQDQLFAAVPKLQACSRGIKVVHNKFPSNDADNLLKHTVRLNNGQSVYIYVEKNCPELNTFADAFTELRAY